MSLHIRENMKKKINGKTTVQRHSEENKNKNTQQTHRNRDAKLYMCFEVDWQF